MARMVHKFQEETKEPHQNSLSWAEVFIDYQNIVNEFFDVFSKDLPDSLPPKRAFKFAIRTDRSVTPPSRPAIRLSVDEQQELEQLKELLPKCLIRHST